MTALRRRSERPDAGRRASGPRRLRLAAAAVFLILGPSRALPLGLERTGEIVAVGGEASVIAPAAVWYDGVRDLLAVAYPNAHRVLLVDRQGSVQKEIGKAGQLQFPRALAATRDGTLYVASPESETIAVFDRYGATLGEEARTLDLSPYRATRPVRASSLFVDENANLYVADRANRQVLVLGSDGKLKRTVRDVGEPADVWADGAGTVYVADSAFGGVRVYDDRGRLVRTVGRSPNQFRDPIRPRALAVDRSKRIWVLEEGSRGIKALDAFGNLLFALSGEGFFAAVDLAIDPRDTLYVLEEGGNRIAVFRISGS